MGCSGRPEFELTNPLDCIDYYVLSIEAWMRTTNYNLDEKFYLLGYKFGAYISIFYAIKFSTNLLGVILLSPIGVMSK